MAAYVGSNEMITQAKLPAVGTLQEFKVGASVMGAFSAALISNPSDAKAVF